jgi:hypothetical protein
MSARELFKQDVDTMPEDVFCILQSIWAIAQERAQNYYYNEVPNAETIAAMKETDYNTYESFEDMMKAVSRFENEGA